MSEAAGSACFELSVAPEAITIASVRRFLGELCARLLSNREITSKVLVATHELLDNSIRHSSSQAASGIRVELHRSVQDVRVVIVTRNHASDVRKSELTRIIDEVHASSERASFYQVLLERVAKGIDGAGLGLGRVHVEADFDLSVRFEEDVVIVRAEGRFPLT